MDDLERVVNTKLGVFTRFLWELISLSVEFVTASHTYKPVFSCAMASCCDLPLFFRTPCRPLKERLTLSLALRQLCATVR